MWLGTIIDSLTLSLAARCGKSPSVFVEFLANRVENCWHYMYLDRARRRAPPFPPNFPSDRKPLMDLFLKITVEYLVQFTSAHHSLGWIWLYNLLTHHCFSKKMDSLGQRSQYISIKFSFLKESENPLTCYYWRQSTAGDFTITNKEPKFDRHDLSSIFFWP